MSKRDIARVGWASVDLPTDFKMVGNDKPVAHPTWLTSTERGIER